MLHNVRVRTDGVFSGRHVFIKAALLRKLAAVAASCVPPLLLMVPRCCECDTSRGISVLTEIRLIRRSSSKQQQCKVSRQSTRLRGWYWSSRFAKRSREINATSSTHVCPVEGKIPDSSQMTSLFPRLGSAKYRRSGMFLVLVRVEIMLILVGSLPWPQQNFAFAFSLCQ